MARYFKLIEIDRDSFIEATGEDLDCYSQLVVPVDGLVYGADYRYFPRHQRTSRTQMRTYNCLNLARADFISRGCGNDYRIVCLKSVEVERVIEFDSPDGYELQNGDWGSDDE